VLTPRRRMTVNGRALDAPVMMTGPSSDVFEAEIDVPDRL
jgi:hypothetical protein